MPPASPGHIVLFTLPSSEPPVNGERTFPAIITQVWSDHCVNLRVFLDAHPSHGTPEWWTSVGRSELPGQACTWCWPPGVER